MGWEYLLGWLKAPHKGTKVTWPVFQYSGYHGNWNNEGIALDEELRLREYVVEV